MRRRSTLTLLQAGNHRYLQKILASALRIRGRIRHFLSPPLPRDRIALLQIALVCRRDLVHVFEGDGTPVAFVLIEAVRFGISRYDLYELVREIKGIMNASVHAHPA